MGTPTSIKFEDHVKTNEITSVPLLDVSRGNDPLKDEFKEVFNGILEQVASSAARTVKRWSNPWPTFATQNTASDAPQEATLWCWL